MIMIKLSCQCSCATVMASFKPLRRPPYLHSAVAAAKRLSETLPADMDVELDPNVRMRSRFTTGILQKYQIVMSIMVYRYRG